jgi:hypothetical protein
VLSEAEHFDLATIASYSALAGLAAFVTNRLCDGLRVVDADIDDPQKAVLVKGIALKIFGPTLARFRENSSRFLLIYRSAAA